MNVKQHESNNLVQESLEPRLALIWQIPQVWVMVFQFLQLHSLVTQLQFLVQMELHCCQDFSWAETAIGNISCLTSCEPWIPATNKDAFRPWNSSLDNTDFSTNEVEDPESHIASTLKLKSLFFSLIRTTGSPHWVMLVATAVVASETFFVVSFFGKSLCNRFLCRFPQLGTLHVLLLQSFDMRPGLK